MYPLFSTGKAFSDTYIYRDWAEESARQGKWLGINENWVYPTLAFIPLIISNCLGKNIFLALWLIVIIILNFTALFIIIYNNKQRIMHKNNKTIYTLWIWLLFISLLSLLYFMRIEGITAPIVLIVLMYKFTKPMLSTILLNVVIWIKLWPMAIFVSYFIITKKKMTVIYTTVIFYILLFFLCIFLKGKLYYLFSFIKFQNLRGMQVESIFSTPFLWMFSLNIKNITVHMNESINSVEIYGLNFLNLEYVIYFFFILALSINVLVTLINFNKNVYCKNNLFLISSFNIICSLIVFNKVGSPQFMIWLMPNIIAGLLQFFKFWKSFASVFFVIILCTYIIYPLFYEKLICGNIVVVSILTLRNILILVLYYLSFKLLLKNIKYKDIYIYIKNVISF